MSPLQESKEQISLRLAVIRLAINAAPYASLILLIVNLASTTLAVLFVYFSSDLLGALPAAARSGWHSSAGRTVAAYFLAAGLSFLFGQVLGPVKTNLGELIKRRVDGVVRDRLAASSVRPAGVAPFEDQELLTQLAMARQGLNEGIQTPGAAVSGLATISGLYAQAFLAAALVAFFVSPLIAVGLLGGGLLIRRSHRMGLARQSRARTSNYDLVRKAEYFRRVGLDGPAGREIRIFGLSGWLSGRFRETSVDSLAASFKIRSEGHGKRFIRPVIIASGFAVLSTLWVAHEATAGHLPIRSLVIFLQAGFMCLQIGNYFPEDWSTQWGILSLQALEKFINGMEASADTDLRRRWAGTGSPRLMPRSSLRFEQVSFHYPGSTTIVLDALNLDIPVGKSLAVVGLNGAGKTTLVKLLAGFYEPSAGKILVDGTDLRLLDLAAWQHNVAAISQDFVRYQFSAAENIAFADAQLPQKMDDIRWAADEAGILEALESLPKGLASPLSSSYRDGADLSGGQWQRVALARAIYAARRGAKILVLDEPTANLDVRAEADFLDRFIDLTRGTTTVVISHRFATVRHADRIVVLQGGSVIEQGSHDSLLDARGRYEHLFRLQADRFTENGAAEEEQEAAT
jgi:ATP-binding cassette, subfamily B, bacterial